MQANRIMRLQLKDGERLTFSINCSPVLGSGGKYAGVLVSFDDVTQLEKKEIELRKSKEEAETANQAKSAFLANMSHEIRTPMTAILGFTEILKRGYGQNTKDSLRYLNTIHSSGQNLLELINDILDLSKVESGRLEIEESWVEPHRIIHDVIKVLDIKAQGKGIALHFRPQGRCRRKSRAIRRASGRSFLTWWATPSNLPTRARCVWTAGSIRRPSPGCRLTLSTRGSALHPKKCNPYLTPLPRRTPR